MKSILCVFSLALLSWATPSSTQSQTEVLQTPTLKVGQEAPWFSATLADNQYGVVNRDLLLKSAQKEGYERMALVWFASWCVPCRMGLNLIAEHEAEIKSAHTKIILVNYQEESPKVLSFLSQNYPNWQPFTLLDLKGGSAHAFGFIPKEGSISLPKTVLLDSKGKILGVYGSEGNDYLSILQGQISP